MIAVAVDVAGVVVVVAAVAAAVAVDDDVAGELFGGGEFDDELFDGELAAVLDFVDCFDNGPADGDVQSSDFVDHYRGD